MYPPKIRQLRMQLWKDTYTAAANWNVNQSHNGRTMNPAREADQAVKEFDSRFLSQRERDSQPVRPAEGE